MTRRVLIHCGAGAEVGLGHLMRSLTLATEALDRGWEVRLGGVIDSEAARRGRAVEPRIEVESVASDHFLRWLSASLASDSPDVIHLDDYAERANSLDVGDALLSNMQDGPYGVRPADLAIDANFRSETWFGRPEESGAHLAGGDAAIIRRQVLRQRDRATSSHERPRVLVVLGGTDAQDLAVRTTAALGRSPVPLDLTVVAPVSRHDAIRSSVTGTPHRLALHAFLDDLPGTAREHDLVVTASGTSVWDFACMGLPMALICAVDNQRAGYETVTRAGLALPFGVAEQVGEADLTPFIDIVTDPARLAAQRDLLRATVDGMGAWRVVSAWEQLCSVGPDASTGRVLTARPATPADTDVLFRWRNDPRTRAASRTSSPVPWADHVRWLDRVLSDPARRLVVVDDGESPVGTVRWDRAGEDWEASITIAPERQGHGLSLPTLRAGEAALRIDRPYRLLAAIHRDNTASRKLFARAGYLPHLPEDDAGFAVYARWIL